ncbi:MAG: hypothetical protein AAF153_00785 [Pseudomonadota bacterium]
MNELKMHNTPLLSVMQRLNREVAKITYRDFHELGHLQASPKNTLDFVSFGYNKAKTYINDSLAQSYPNIPTIHYSTSDNMLLSKDKECFVVKLFDGASSFSRQLPTVAHYYGHWQHLNGKWQEQLCLLDLPIFNECYTAIANHGGFRSLHKFDQVVNYKLKTSQRKANLTSANHLGSKNTNQLNFGSALTHTAFVAAGKLDAAQGLKFNNTVLAGLLIVAAGGKIADNGMVTNSYV